MSKEYELIELSTKLSTLKEKGLISEVEYQEIVCNGPLVERALLKLLFTKYRLHGANIWKLFEVLTAEIPVAVVKIEDSGRLQHAGGENQQTVNPLHEKNRNPLLIDTVLRSVFELLTFEEIKKYRLVSHQWDSTAQPFLRRTGIIHFQPQSLVPSRFLEVFEENLPEVPFTSFRFSNVESNIVWSVSQLQMFFDSWGRNIKHLELLNICLGNQSQFDVTPWLEKATSLTKLTIKCYSGNSGRLISHGRSVMNTPLQIQLDKLKSVKYLHLNGHKILICLSNKKFTDMIAPLEINLNDVRFIETELVGLNANDVVLVRLNNYIDFSQAKNIILTPYVKNYTYRASFDMASQDFKARNVVLRNMEILNWNKAKGKIDYLTLSEMRLIERNELEIKKFVVKSCTIDMSIIPMTMEQIHFVNRRTIIICDYSIVLPNLVFLGFKKVTQHCVDMLSRFAYCNNLVEIEIVNFDPLKLTVSMIPKSVKTMKINWNVMLVRGENGVVHTLDKLILEEKRCEMTIFLNRVAIILSPVMNICVKVLVIYTKFRNFDDVVSHYESVIINFLKTNPHLEKVIVSNVEDLFVRGNRKSGCVNTKSHYYEFEKNNTVRKSITKYQFSLWESLNALTME